MRPRGALEAAVLRKQPRLYLLRLYEVAVEAKAPRGVHHGVRRGRHLSGGAEVAQCIMYY